jgi:glyoxylase-like metal-dependent hydrolase (beta-lactamase superfamily II)
MVEERRMTGCKLHVLRAGACYHLARMARRDACLCPMEFPALVGLILHPTEGAILFDTGYDPAFFTATHEIPERFYRWMTPVKLGPGEAVATQLHRFGLKPEDVRGVVVSHFHGDHVAGLHAFPRARIFCSRFGAAEVARPGRFARVRRGVLASLAPADMGARATFFEDLPFVSAGGDMAPFETGADLFGDGSLVAINLPGHCPGHWGLAMRDEDGRRTFMIGDAAWSRSAVRDNVPPPRLTTSLLGDTRVYRETLLALNHLHRNNSEIVLLPSHCPEAAELAARHGH